MSCIPIGRYLDVDVYVPNRGCYCTVYHTIDEIDKPPISSLYSFSFWPRILALTLRICMAARSTPWSLLL